MRPELSCCEPGAYSLIDSQPAREATSAASPSIIQRLGIGDDISRRDWRAQRNLNCRGGMGLTGRLAWPVASQITEETAPQPQPRRLGHRRLSV